jgi:hypothetical protein
VVWEGKVALAIAAAKVWAVTGVVNLAVAAVPEQRTAPAEANSAAPELAAAPLMESAAAAAPRDRQARAAAPAGEVLAAEAPEQGAAEEVEAAEEGGDSVENVQGGEPSVHKDGYRVEEGLVFSVSYDSWHPTWSIRRHATLVTR